MGSRQSPGRRGGASQLSRRDFSGELLLASVAAERDLTEIYAYTLRIWGARQADAYLDDLRTACTRIPEGRAIARRLAFRNDGLSSIRQGRHLILFQDRSDAIVILRVLHESMDLDAHLED